MGLLADAEYDLAIMMCEEWGIVEPVSTGLSCRQLGLEPSGSLMLRASDWIAADYPNFD